MLMAGDPIMRRRQSKAVKTAGGLLVGGVATGFLLAMTVPTTMRQHAGDSWRELVRDPVSTYEPVTFAAAPEDLTPVYWQPASAEYPAGPDPYAHMDLDVTPAEPALLSEQLPDEILQTREGGVTVQLVHTDEAAFSAQAAQAAAADVRTVETTAIEAPAPAPAPPLIEPQAVATAS
jgi:hypothetical protein